MIARAIASGLIPCARSVGSVVSRPSSCCWYACPASPDRLHRRQAGLEQPRHLLTLAGHGVRRLANQEGEQADRFHQAEELVLGTQMPEIQHPLIEVLPLARLEQRGDGLEQIVRSDRRRT